MEEKIKNFKFFEKSWNKKFKNNFNKMSENP